ncbi:MAG: hypothetical protein LBV04_07700 [Deferribacteraceae bacterium]|jgi:transposase|nr:hypothetical protein [Deferribacteraceae bacterium]
MRAISNDKRELIIAAKARGEKIATIALWIGVSEKTVNNICRQHKQTNSITPKPFLGRKTKLTDKQISQIRQAVESQCDITLEELILKLNLPIKKSRLSSLLINMGLTYKERLSMPKSNSEPTFKKSEQHGTKAKQS